MGRYHRHGVESTAAIAGHPLHHMLVALPIGLLIGALASDIAFRVTADTFWARGTLWLLIGGIVTALVAAIPGFIDFMTIHRVRDLWISWTHMIANLAVVGLAAVNAWLRLDDPVAGAQGIGLWLSVAQTALLFFSGWLGGELAYRYGIGAIRDYSPEVEQFHVEIERDEAGDRLRPSGSRGQ
jgi:uncharacterized membrane protein